MPLANENDPRRPSRPPSSRRAFPRHPEEDNACHSVGTSELPMHPTESSKPSLQCTRAFRHPLEIIPFFGRFQPSVPRDLIYTAIWNSLFALFFTALSVLMARRRRRG